MNEPILKQIIDKYDTPSYVYDIEILKNRISYIRKHLPSRAKICYAIKANTFIIKDIEREVDRFEVCSPGEYEICKKQNVDESKILISGINKSKEEIDHVIETSNVRFFSIESMSQFEIFKNSSKKVELLLRLTSGNQFGINKEEIEEIITNRDNYSNIKLKGIQYFSGTQKTSIKVLRKELEKLDSFFKELKQKYNYEAEEFEFGTGFPINYFQGRDFDENEFFKEFSEIVDNLEYGGNIIFEIGRSIVASCGTYITKVIDIKTNKNQKYAIVDGGINHLVYYGQSMAMKVPYLEIHPSRENKEDERWNICGSLCTINDILVKQLPEKIELNDIIVFKNTGAYCSTEGISLFLSRDLPNVIKIDEDKSIKLIREKNSTFQFNG
ncbi:MAG: alanine racemase [Clostridia bacterium]|nr:alanine racemase [Clostridia bacterium]